MQQRLGTQIHITPAWKEEYNLEQVQELTDKGKALQYMENKFKERAELWEDTESIRKSLKFIIDWSIHSLYNALLYHAVQIDKKDIERIQEASLTYNKHKWED